MLEQLRNGDVVTVTKYDRLARSLKDLLEIVETIRERGAGFRSLAEDIDTTTPAGVCSMSSHPSLSSSGSGFPSEQGKGWSLRASGAASAVDPLPYRLPRRMRCGV